MATDASGNVYVTDTGNNTVRKISAGGVVTTLAGQPGVSGTADGVAGAARFNAPDQIATDAAGNIYVADHGIRKISGGSVTTIYSSGPVADSNGVVSTVTAGSSLAAGPAGEIYFSGSTTSWLRWAPGGWVRRCVWSNWTPAESPRS